MAFDAGPVAKPRAQVARGWRAMIARWRENRAARRVLIDCLATDPRFARDIGLTPAEIDVEAVKPFWMGIRRP
jgi:uncharacterized protein YjiS (DUF1127 family)